MIPPHTTRYAVEMWNVCARAISSRPKTFQSGACFAAGSSWPVGMCTAEGKERGGVDIVTVRESLNRALADWPDTFDHEFRSCLLHAGVHHDTTHTNRQTCRQWILGVLQPTKRKDRQKDDDDDDDDDVDGAKDATQQGHNWPPWKATGDEQQTTSESLHRNFICLDDETCFRPRIKRKPVGSGRQLRRHSVMRRRKTVLRTLLVGVGAGPDSHASK